MESETEKALRQSIVKWERIAQGVGTEKGPKNCALCQRFLEDDCQSCPVALKGGRDSCGGTPYDVWTRAQQSYRMERLTRIYSLDQLKSAGFLNQAEYKTAVRIAQEEVDFLRSLLPKKGI